MAIFRIALAPRQAKLWSTVRTDISLRRLLSYGAAYQTGAIRLPSHSGALTSSQGQDKNMLQVTSRDHVGSAKAYRRSRGDSPGF